MTKIRETHIHTETLNLDCQECIHRESLIELPTKRCLQSTEIHQNPDTKKVTLVITKQFDPRSGNMIEQRSDDYKQGISTTEIWPSSNGVQEPLSITRKNFLKKI